MIGLGWAISLFQRGKASMNRIERLTGSSIDIFDAPDAVETTAQGTIEVRDLTFTYPVPREEDSPDEPVLKDVSFTIEPGKTLGIFGPVASGKSTIASLLTRLYEPPENTVFIDGTDVRNITLDSLRRAIVLAPQETFLFSTTVERNIALGEVETLETLPVTELAHLAHLHQDVVAFEHGYNTMLGERGVNLSGGQRQRLAIARAVAADPAVLILDDCLSAVDSKTEESILNNLRKVFAGRTGIIVSHRVRAVRDCDQIIVLEHGRVAERGTHEELLENDGYYAQIAEEQTRASAA